MSAKLMGSIDIMGGLLLIIVRPYFGEFSLLSAVLEFTLIGKGLMSWF